MINNTVKVQRERLAAPTSQALLTAQLDPSPRCANRLGLRSLHHCFHIYLYWWGTFTHVRPLCKVQNIWCWEKCVWSSFFIHPSDNSRDSCTKVVSSPPTMYLNRLKQTSSKCHWACLSGVPGCCCTSGLQLNWTTAQATTRDFNVCFNIVFY